MKIDYQTMKNLTVGAAEIWEESDGLHFAKCTQAQVAAWEKEAPWLSANVAATTGIRLDFDTDSSFVQFSVAAGKKFEMMIDGVLTHQFLAQGENQSCTFRVELGERGNRKHIVFSLPSHGQPGVLTGMELDDGAYAQKHSFDRKLLFLGDSITQGWDSHYDQLSYAYQVSRALNGESIIQGVGGGFFAPKTLSDIDFCPDMVFVAYGTNDFCHFSSLQEVRERATNYLHKVKQMYSMATVYVITPIWRQDLDAPRPMGTFAQCCNLIKEVATSLELNVIDGNKLVPHLEGFFFDDVHPNGLGFTFYAQNLLKKIGC